VWVEHVSEALAVALGSGDGERSAAGKAAPSKVEKDQQELTVA